MALNMVTDCANANPFRRLRRLKGAIVSCGRIGRLTAQAPRARDTPEASREISRALKWRWLEPPLCGKLQPCSICLKKLKPSPAGSPPRSAFPSTKPSGRLSKSAPAARGLRRGRGQGPEGMDDRGDPRRVYRPRPQGQSPRRGKGVQRRGPARVDGALSAWKSPRPNPQWSSVTAIYGQMSRMAAARRGAKTDPRQFFWLHPPANGSKSLRCLSRTRHLLIQKKRSSFRLPPKCAWAWMANGLGLC